MAAVAESCETVARVDVERLPTTEVARGQSRTARLLVLCTVMTISAVYVSAHLTAGWVPADDGILGQSAVRAFQGQLPHRDFAEIYTGGLSFLHAAAFRVFGTNLLSLRICTFLFFLAWLPAVFYIAMRFVSPVASGLITLVAVAWSFPNYPVAMPSWYNLFLATFGACALLRYLEVRRRGWLFLAGVCGGLSLLIKAVGMYYVAGVLLSLAFLEQTECEPDGVRKPSRGYQMFSAAMLVLFLTTLVYVLRSRLGSAEFYHFVLPSSAMVGLILAGERRGGGRGTTERFRHLLGILGPFVAGLLTVLAVFLIPYALSGAVHTIFEGVASSVAARSVDLAVIRPLRVGRGIFALPVVALISMAMYWKRMQGRILGLLVGLGLALLSLASTKYGSVTRSVWSSAAMLTPVIVLLGAIRLSTWPPAAHIRRRQQAVVLLSLAATCYLVQFPFAAPIYFCYSAPLTLLAMVALVTIQRKQLATSVLASLLGFYLLFGIIELVPGYIYELTHAVGEMQPFRISRGRGIRVEYASAYEEAVQILQQHSPNGLMFAGNECPELYFLSGLRNTTRDDGGAPPEQILQAIRSEDLKLVVINESPYFPTARMQPQVRAEIMRRFPYWILSGRYRIFWRE